MQVAPTNQVAQGTLGDIADVVMGQSPVGSSYNREHVGTPLINGPTEFTDRCPVPTQWTTAPVRFCKPNDVLICVRGSSTGRMNVADASYCIGRGVAAVHARGENDQNYVRYALAAVAEELLQLQSGSTFPSIDSRVIRGGSILVPGSDEQERIGRTLLDADDWIAALERLIAKKQDIKQGMMQQLLTGITRLPGYAGRWERKSLRNIVETPVTDGPHMTPEFLTSGIPFLSVNNLVHNRIDLSDLRYVSRADHELFSRKCAPRRGDILLGKAASVGKVAIVDTGFEFNIWSPIAMIRVGFGHVPRFVFYQLQSASLVAQIALLTNSSSQGNIGMGDIEKLVFDLPTPHEQLAISELLSDVDREIDLLRAHLTKAKSLKQGMMQELLTGRTRLPVKEPAI